MFRFHVVSCALIAGLLSSTALAGLVVTVPATSDPYLAGMPNGSTASLGDVAPNQSPVLVAGVLPAAGSAITFSATGSMSFGGGSAAAGPDGNQSFYTQHLNHSVGATASPENGIADMAAPADALVGVFLGPNQPSLTTAPGLLNFSASGLGINFTSLSPVLQQPFFIGDGLTSGAITQTFIVPAGATRLYLATMDGEIWNDNTGSFSVQVNGVTAPEPASLAILSVSSLLLLRRRVRGAGR